jgi:SNF2 family DNA or RNA helicase
MRFHVDGTKSGSATEAEADLQEISPPSKYTRKGKRKAGEKVEWSDGESDNAYEKFKNRASAKRQKVSRAKALAKTRTKDANALAKSRNKAGASSSSKEKEPRIWGQESDTDIEEDAMPDYLLRRRKKLDRETKVLPAAGLRLPPDYEDIEFSDDYRIDRLEERPTFPPSIKKSRKYLDIELPRSLGVIPAPIAQYLRDYQVDGVAFLHELFVYQKGGILGDDMGLGKTVQVAAFLAAALGKTGDERDAKRMRKMRRAPGSPWYPKVLIVCPGSLIENWRAELNRWGYWHADIFHGDNKEAVLSMASSGRLEIMITTYHTYKTWRSKINLIDWDCVVADECHQLKEITSETTRAMNEVNALCRIGLTGTAIQNKYEELWTLLNWTNPGRFGPISLWKSTISEPLRVGQSHDATLYQLSRARKTAKKLVENLLPQFFLRRMKSLIAHQLPKKTDKVVFCPLTALQQDAYERFLESPHVQLVKRSSELCECKSGKKRGWCCHSHLEDGVTKWQVIVFPVIATLSKLANHLALLIPSSTDLAGDKQQRQLDFLKEMIPDRWQDLYENRDSLIHLSNPEFCGKWKILKKLLRFWHANGDKVLVFSHSVKLLKMLHQLFNNTSYNVSFLDGSLSYEDRQKVVDDYNSDSKQFVFLISTKAGGVGLNITSANKVVIMDPNWNPSYDLQAQDRAYRIGQVRDVEVFRLVSAGTIEEIVYARQIYKQQQANIGYNASMERRYFKGVQNSKGQKGEIFGLKNLLTFHGDDVVLRDIVNKTNVAEAKAGVNLIDIDMDNDEDNPLAVDDNSEDAAMSQLALLLTEGDGKSTKKKARATAKTDAIQAILASAGVEYTHENSEVVGTSRVESHLSRRAEETVNDASLMDEVLFADSQSHRDGDVVAGSGDKDKDRIDYVYRPPREVMVRQFCTMAKTFGFDSVTEFALVVEGWTQEQRRNCLDAFYRKRKEMLAELRDEKEAGGADLADDVVDPDVTLDLEAIAKRSHDVLDADAEKQPEATLDKHELTAGAMPTATPTTAAIAADCDSDTDEGDDEL